MQNPFTTTFSKVPEYTYIATPKTDEILENFSYEKHNVSVKEKSAKNVEK